MTTCCQWYFESSVWTSCVHTSMISRIIIDAYDVVWSGTRKSRQIFAHFDGSNEVPRTAMTIINSRNGCVTSLSIGSIEFNCIFTMTFNGGGGCGVDTKYFLCPSQSPSWPSHLRDRNSAKRDQTLEFACAMKVCSINRIVEKRMDRLVGFHSIQRQRHVLFLVGEIANDDGPRKSGFYNGALEKNWAFKNQVAKQTSIRWWTVMLSITSTKRSFALVDDSVIEWRESIVSPWSVT